jgi:hypothetical protein
MNDPRTPAGRWLLDHSQWEEGLRAFRVRINATGGPDDMHRHVLAIEQEAVADPRLDALLAAARDIKARRDGGMVNTGEIDALIDALAAFDD